MSTHQAESATGAVGSRIAGIDTLRGLSILAVLLLHIRTHFPGVGEGWPAAVSKVVFFDGFDGVRVFFTLSGFLITTTCLRRWGSLGRVAPLAFYRLRFARIVPCLLGVLAVSAALHLAGVTGFVVHSTSLRRATLAALAFHVNWLESKVGYLPANWDVLWSLSVEETFYLLFPLAGRYLGRALVPLLLALVVLGPFARVTLTDSELWADYSYLSCMDAIALGCLAALAVDRLRGRTLEGARAVGVAALLLVMVAKGAAGWLGLYRTGLDVSLLAAGTALLAMAFTRRDAAGTRAFAPLRWLGVHSYEVYLTHAFVIVGLARLPFPGRSVATLGLCSVLGYCVARFYSEPLNRRLRSGRSSAGEAVAAPS